MIAVSKTTSPPQDPDVAIDIRCDRWLENLPQVMTLCRRAAAAALAGAGETNPSDSEISIVLADDDFVQTLNRSWRDQDSPTNVLAFPAAGDEMPQDGARLLGDVVVAFQTSQREATDQGKTLDDHLSHLIVHGVLHLLGYDHLADEEAEQMERLETDVLSGLGIKAPYDDQSV